LRLHYIFRKRFKIENRPSKTNLANSPNANVENSTNNVRTFYDKADGRHARRA